VLSVAVELLLVLETVLVEVDSVPLELVVVRVLVLVLSVYVELLLVLETVLVDVDSVPLEVVVL
jgi:hypothetical protein